MVVKRSWNSFVGSTQRILSLKFEHPEILEMFPIIATPFLIIGAWRVMENSCNHGANCKEWKTWIRKIGDWEERN